MKKRKKRSLYLMKGVGGVSSPWDKKKHKKKTSGGEGNSWEMGDVSLAPVMAMMSQQMTQQQNQMQLIMQQSDRGMEKIITQMQQPRVRVDADEDDDANSELGKNRDSRLQRRIRWRKEKI